MGQDAESSRDFSPGLRGPLNISFDCPAVVNDYARFACVQVTATSEEHLIELVQHLFVCPAFAWVSAFNHRSEKHDRVVRIYRAVRFDRPVSVGEDAYPPIDLDCAPVASYRSSVPRTFHLGRMKLEVRRVTSGGEIASQHVGQTILKEPGIALMYRDARKDQTRACPMRT